MGDKVAESAESGKSRASRRGGGGQSEPRQLAATLEKYTQQRDRSSRPWGVRKQSSSLRSFKAPSVSPAPAPAPPPPPPPWTAARWRAVSAACTACTAGSTTDRTNAVSSDFTAAVLRARVSGSTQHVVWRLEVARRRSSRTRGRAIPLERSTPLRPCIRVLSPPRFSPPRFRLSCGGMTPCKDSIGGQERVNLRLYAWRGRNTEAASLSLSDRHPLHGPSSHLLFFYFLIFGF